jgi:putative heme-binding domain-containing protein
MISLRQPFVACLALAVVAPTFGQHAVPAAISPAALQVAPGFKVELLYTVPKEDQGSWVALTVDPKGRIYAGDQYGSIYRLTVPPLGTSEGTKVEKLPFAIPADVYNDRGELVPPPPKKGKGTDGTPPAVGAHGLLYAFDSLYVMVDEVPNRRGVWRLRDTNGDDKFDEVKYLREMKSVGGEHGPHSLVLSPDGKSIYIANGNHTDLPEHLDKSRPVRWDEDHLLPRMWDARGHAKGKYAPGGYVARMDRDGKSMELFALGFRNQFDIAFDQNGELFTYDSDMEWDQGSPWYVPTRINHIVDAGDYGWRSGAGRWPAYYADSLPAVIDIGPGSPTGTIFGTGAKFPAKYQRALFAADWTYGTLYAIHFKPAGATFTAEKEEFVAGKPLPLTDLVIHPDGAMYFAVGGRKTQSALYRVTYTGTESTAPVKALPPTPEALLRHKLEALHAEGTGPEAIEIAWPHLSSPDRFIRWAARAAIERQLPANWTEQALAEKNPQAAVEALIALARVGEKHFQPQIIDALTRLGFAKQPAELQLPILRAWELVFTRMGKPDAATCARVAAKLEPLFPAQDRFVNRELISLLIFLDSPTIVAKAVPLLKIAEPTGTAPEEVASRALLARNDNYGRTVQSVTDARPDRQQIAYAYALRNATVGWTPALRTQFFSWFPTTREWKGGASFVGFLRNIRNESLAKIADSHERQKFDDLSKVPVSSIVAGAATPKGPGQTYTVASAFALFPEKLTGRDFAQGKAMVNASACLFCHRFNNDGAGIGPDITGAGNRYSVKDMLENIIEPSKVISDQYGTEELTMDDGETIIGRVVAEDVNRYSVMTNPFAPDELARPEISKVRSRKPYPISMMPTGLINALNPEELKDLVAYLLSGGNPADPMFAKAK